MPIKSERDAEIAGFVKSSDGHFYKSGYGRSPDKASQAEDAGDDPYTASGRSRRSPSPGQIPPAKVPRQARAMTRLTPEDRLNKTEKRFLAVLRSRTDRFSQVGIQDITLKLGWDTRYTADFSTVDYNRHVSLWEVKGFMRDDARVKLYAAAKQFPCFTFWKVEWDNAEWVETIINC